MFGRLLLLFTVVPAVELYLLIRIGQWIGAAQTVAIIIITGSIGAFLAKREGLGVIRQLQQDTLQGIPPGDRIVEGLLVLVGGAFLITPGVLTDLTGFLLIMPPSRRFLAPRIKAWVTRRLLADADVRIYAAGSRPRDPL
ncbi:MAG: FxsA family protein, partial [Deltaproteobacteria bacterium]